MPLPVVVSNWLDRVRSKQKDEQVADSTTAGEAEDGAADEGGLANFMPSPRAAAVAVMALLAFGVMIGSLNQQVAQSAGITTVLLGEPASAPESVDAPEEEEEVETVTVAPEAAAAEAALPEAPEAAPEEEATPVAPPPPKLELPPEPALPPISHVFLIVLGEQGYEDTFGADSTSTYFSKTLPEQGELLSNYYAVAPGDLSNEIALLSGQGPTVQTAANCPEYADLAPSTLGLAEQVEGAGCVYPEETQTLPGQLVTAKQSWKAYVEDIGNGEAGQPTTCRRPSLGTLDPDSLPSAGDGYETWRNPLVYFHSIADGAECSERDVGLDRLGADLKNVKRTPTLSYIVPDACHDGSEVPCEPGQPAGLSGAESFLQTVVPEIQKSQAYGGGGLIAITFAQAPQAGPKADSSSCCGTPEYPNLKAAGAPPPEPVNGPVKPSGGGGRVGMLLISPFVLPGSINESGYYNHYSMLRSMEELFGLPAIGYAAEPAILPFDEAIYNNSES
jgi:phosphatidylinositol-3-phosphatase